MKKIHVCKYVIVFLNMVMIGYFPSYASPYGYALSFVKGAASAEQKKHDLLFEQAQDNDVMAQLIVGLRYRQPTEQCPTSESMKWLQRAAAQGNGRAQFHMGGCSVRGIGVEKNDDKALKWFLRSDQAGFMPAQLLLLRAGKVGFAQEKNIVKSITDSMHAYTREAKSKQVDGLIELGLSYELGDGVEQNLIKAYELYMQAGHKGFQHLNHLTRCHDYALKGVEGYKDTMYFFDEIDCQYLLGIAYLDGIGVSKNIDLAISMLKNASQQNHGGAMYHYAECQGNQQICDRSDMRPVSILYQKAIDLLYDQAEAGFADAQFALGMCYAFGKGVEKDLEEAFAWFLKAAVQGHDQAQYHVGFSYAHGEGVEKDEHKACQWFERAALQEVAGAQYELGYIYGYGKEMPRDDVRASEWLERASEQGHKEAQYVMGLRYSQALGVSYSDKRVIKWTTEAAQQGHKEAQYLLGTYYDAGWHAKLDHEQAHYWFEKATDQHHAYAQFRLGHGIDQGQGCTKDHARAVKLCEQVIDQIAGDADKGNPEAQNMLGLSYQNDLGRKVDLNRAKEWFELAASQGYVHAQHNYAVLCKEMSLHEEAIKMFEIAARQKFPYAMHALGGYRLTGAESITKTCRETRRYIIEKNIFEAMLLFCDAAKWGLSAGVEELQKLVQDGNLDAYNQLAICYYYGWGCKRDPERAVYLLIPPADKNHRIALANLGECYYLGKGVAKDYARAFKNFKDADLEHGDCGFYLGECYFFGRGVRQNYEKAVNLYRTSAEKGNAKAAYKLAVCFHDGKGVDKDVKKSQQLFRYAVELLIRNLDCDDELEKCYLAYCYEMGYGVDQNYVQAVEYYKDAAEHGNVEAQINLAYCYNNGLGIRQDSLKAMHWYGEAAKQGDETGEFALGEFYEHGIAEVLPRDEKEAFRLYEKAAQKGEVGAQYKVALYYEKGNVVSKDLKAAFSWYKKAAEQGHVEAQYRLGKCYENGIGVEKNPSQAKRWLGKAVRNGFVEKKGEAGPA